MNEVLLSLACLQERLFIADIRRMFSNCFKFNAVDTLYYKAGYDLCVIAHALVKAAFPNSDIFPEIPNAEPECWLQLRL